MIRNTSKATYHKYSWEGGFVSISEDLTSLLEELKQKPTALEPVVRKHALNIAAVSSANAPVESGTLKNTLAAGVEMVDKNNATISDGTDYGVFQELGTKSISAKHFLGGAAEREAEPFFEDVRKALES